MYKYIYYILEIEILVIKNTPTLPVTLDCFNCVLEN